MTVQDVCAALQAKIKDVPFSISMNGEPMLTRRDVIAVVQAFYAALIIKGEPTHA